MRWMLFKDYKLLHVVYNRSYTSLIIDLYETTIHMEA